MQMMVQPGLPPIRRVVMAGVGAPPRNEALYCNCGASCRDTAKDRRRFLRRHSSHGVSDSIPTVLMPTKVGDRYLEMLVLREWTIGEELNTSFYDLQFRCRILSLGEVTSFGVKAVLQVVGRYA
jgi:hypothetical protein